MSNRKQATARAVRESTELASEQALAPLAPIAPTKQELALASAKRATERALRKQAAQEQAIAVLAPSAKRKQPSKRASKRTESAEQSFAPLVIGEIVVIGESAERTEQRKQERTERTEQESAARAFSIVKRWAAQYGYSEDVTSGAMATLYKSESGNQALAVLGNVEPIAYWRTASTKSGATTTLDACDSTESATDTETGSGATESERTNSVRYATRTVILALKRAATAQAKRALKQRVAESASALALVSGAIETTQAVALPNRYRLTLDALLGDTSESERESAPHQVNVETLRRALAVATGSKSASVAYPYPFDCADTWQPSEIQALAVAASVANDSEFRIAMRDGKRVTDNARLYVAQLGASEREQYGRTLRDLSKSLDTERSRSLARTIEQESALRISGTAGPMGERVDTGDDCERLALSRYLYELGAWLPSATLKSKSKSELEIAKRLRTERLSLGRYLLLCTSTGTAVVGAIETTATAIDWSALSRLLVPDLCEQVSLVSKQALALASVAIERNSNASEYGHHATGDNATESKSGASVTDIRVPIAVRRAMQSLAMRCHAESVRNVRRYLATVTERENYGRATQPSKLAAQRATGSALLCARLLKSTATLAIARKSESTESKRNARLVAHSERQAALAIPNVAAWQASATGELVALERTEQAPLTLDLSGCGAWLDASGNRSQVLRASYRTESEHRAIAATKRAAIKQARAQALESAWRLFTGIPS